MVDDKDKKVEDQSRDDDWDFTTVKPTVKYETPEDATESQVKDTKLVTRKKPQLILDESAAPRMKTRSEMAAELSKGNEDEEWDSFVYASVIKRSLAFLIDLIFLGILAIVSYYMAPLCRKILQLFLDRYKIELFLSDANLMNFILLVNMAIAVFFFVVIPVAFYNHSLGKKLLGLKMRGSEKLRIGIDQAMARELVYKPLGILMIIGFFVPFFNKKRQAFHDMQSETIVIEEE